MKRIIFVILTFCSSFGFSMYTELGLNYAYKKTFIDSFNNTEQQGVTGSVSLYIWERVAIEISYTNSLYVKKEQNQASITTSIRTTSQVADIYGLDLIYVFADRKASFQPYVKAGVAYINKNQTTQIDNQTPWKAGPYVGNAPSAGIGVKFFITDTVAIKAGYDIISTPIDNNAVADDINGRVGLSWIF